MASPHASSFMCLPFSTNKGVRTAYNTYYGVCLTSAAIGTAGSVLFLFQVSCGMASKAISKSQKNILINLSVADLLANIGVIIRSFFYLLYWLHNDHSLDNNIKLNSDHLLVPAIGGAIIEFWVVFWYLASYFWTFFFAVDIYTSKHNGRWRLWYSHIVTWTYCVALATTGIIALWICKPALECAVDKYCIVGHFLCTLGPILIFLVALPIFYISTLQKMEKTYNKNVTVEVREREKQKAKIKVLLFILVFYFCWFVNLIDGIILIVVHLVYKGPSVTTPSFLYEPGYIYSIWIIEATVNPLQGLLNALAYGNAYQAISRWCKKKETKWIATVSFSGEYIDVDFREGRGNIWTQRKKALSC